MVRRQTCCYDPYLTPFGSPPGSNPASITTKRDSGATAFPFYDAETPMPNQGTESQFEATTIDRLLALPVYRYQYGGDIERDWREVVMVDWLRAFLLKKYPHLPTEAVEEAIIKISRPEGVTSEQRNMAFHKLLTGGWDQKYRRPDGTEAYEHIQYVDWNNPVEN